IFGAAAHGRSRSRGPAPGRQYRRLSAAGGSPIPPKAGSDVRLGRSGYPSRARTPGAEGDRAQAAGGFAGGDEVGHAPRLSGTSPKAGDVFRGDEAEIQRCGLPTLGVGPNRPATAGTVAGEEQTGTDSQGDPRRERLGDCRGRLFVEFGLYVEFGRKSGQISLISVP